ncbi:MAG: HAMP domain-containing sensor histidine kinase [Kofleriaceae bacterium]
MRSRRIWVYVLSVLALLVPAGGIAYLGASSYRDQKGAVAAQLERQRVAATAIKGRIDAAIVATLDAADRAATAGQTGALPRLGRYWFWIDASGQLRVPHVAAPLPTTEALVRPAPSNGRIDAYAKWQRESSDRTARLHAARRAESARQLADAKRLYGTLIAFDDTGPEALLGLSRVVGRMGDPQHAAPLLDELDRRFGGRLIDGVPASVVTALLRAEAAGDGRPNALVDVATNVLDGHYPSLDPIVGLGIVQRIRGELDAVELPNAVRGRLPALDSEVEVTREHARAAAGLADDREDIVRTAQAEWRGRPAAKQPNRTLIYRRRADGSVIGIAVDNAMLVAAAGHDPHDDVAKNAHPVIAATGSVLPPDQRLLDPEPMGERLAHLQLELVNPIADPDPRDEVVHHRERTHIVFTSALALMLGIGLLATIRGAARARELAQLKSDFVSTVSHELKTPLTSIRMFAEMLQQGVAQGDAEKMHRYHGVIVQESQRLGLLIANLLDYAQIERGTRRYTAASVDVGELGRTAVATFESLSSPKAGRNPIHVEVSERAMTAEVEVDRDVVIGAVLNLLANAAKYGGPDKPIEVLIDGDAERASISVRDHGPGIPAVEQARIFKEFYRTPEAYRSNVEGTGLGLALVKRHIEALGGTVEVASTVGEGATFTLHLPRVQEVVA